MMSDSKQTRPSDASGTPSITFHATGPVTSWADVSPRGHARKVALQPVAWRQQAPASTSKSKRSPEE
jgi:hypothetical protein